VTDLPFWPRLLLAVLATWRVTHLVAREDGPGDLLVQLRRRAGHGVLGGLMDCFYCASAWVAVPFTVVVIGLPREPWLAWVVDLGVTWLALSGAACLLDRATEPPLVVERGDADAVAGARNEE
jgi:hypothetical protein